MVSRLLLSYAVVELAVVFALAATIGFGWTLLVLLATFVLGFGLLAPLGGWQLGRRLLWLRSGLAEPRSALSDGALVTVASVLVLVPGLVTTTMGLLLLVPPIRALARPGLTAIAAFGESGTDPDFIDGEVIDVIDVEPLTLQPPRVAAEPPSPGSN